MYSPGPVNLLGFNEGLKGNFSKSVGYFAGVGFAMLTLCMLLGYLGETVVQDSLLPYLAMVGCIYIVYLSHKIFKAVSEMDVAQLEREKSQKNLLSFRDGLFMQWLNPKAWLALVPITTIMFPASNIAGLEILAYALAIGGLAMWAPGSYCYIGSLIHRRGVNAQFLKGFNYLMVAFLLVSAAIVFYEYVLLEL